MNEQHIIKVQHGWTGDPYRAFCSCGWEARHGRSTEAAAQRDGDEHVTSIP